MSKRIAKKVLLIGWDAADWKVINPMLDAGELPTLQGLVEGGVMGNLATLDPPLSPMLWTSIGTGMRPYKHGILGFTEPDPNGKGIRAVQSTSRKVKAIWNILSQQGIRSHVVGWWPSHPAEPINGISISNFYQRAKKNSDEDWPLIPGTVHPQEYSELFRELRIHPQELTQEHILPFVPKAAEVDQEADRRLATLAKVLAENCSIHNAATYILEHEEWEFAAVYLDGIDHFCHAFMKFHPPRLEHVDRHMQDIYQHVVRGAYKFHDMMLERLLRLAGPDTHVLLLSDHGFQPDHLRPKNIPKEPAGPASEHSPYGIICLRGDGVKQDERIYGASILDITPTLLHLFGLPVGQDMDGKVLVNAFTERSRPESILSWEDVEGDSGMHPEEMQLDPYSNKAVLDQLIELGYIQAPDGDEEVTLQRTVDENNFYLARAYMNALKFREAVPILEDLFARSPHLRYGLRLAQCYQQDGRLLDCRAIVETIKEIQGEESPRLYMLEGSLLLAERKPKDAMRYFEKAERMASALPGLNLNVGRGYTALGKWKEAEGAFRAELALDKHQAAAHQGLGLALLRQEAHEAAAASLLNAIGLQFHFPLAHFHLGEALFGLKDFQRAQEAFEVSLRMTPNLNKARQWLAKIHEAQGKTEQAESMTSELLENTEGTIYVVSGLPRSGTSMMMQMLSAGGLQVLTDTSREADDSNPRGYFEHEAIKNLAARKDVLLQATGKGVKVISQLLYQLPPRFRYKVIFMQRDIHEVMHSQHRMLAKQGKLKAEVLPLNIKTAFERNLAQVKSWLPKQLNMEVLYLDYPQVLAAPVESAGKVRDFLAVELDTQAMAAVVDPSLHRERSADMASGDH